MIHKFISNDNKGNVNTLEIGSDYTKISKVVDPVNSDDAVNKRYVDHAAGKFIVTLTPTAADYSGTMDKTVAEINAAYEAGQEIWFKVNTGLLEYSGPLTQIEHNPQNAYPYFSASMTLVSNGTIIFVHNSSADDGTSTAYSTNVYALTPAS